MRVIKFRAWDKENMEIREGSKGMYKQNGYILAKASYHPHANKRGYVPLHRLIMENQLGRYLTPRKELVHHIDGDRSNNEVSNLKLTTPTEHYMDEHFEVRNPNGQFVANEPIFGEIKFRLFDRDKNLVQIYSLQELISKTYRRAKFEFRGRFTGLKDKNGTEIYDGDYIRYSMRTINGSIYTHVCRVFQHESGTWRIEGYHEDNHSYETKGTVYAVRLICEVIGNIYETQSWQNND